MPTVPTISSNCYPGSQDSREKSSTTPRTSPARRMGNANALRRPRPAAARWWAAPRRGEEAGRATGCLFRPYAPCEALAFPQGAGLAPRRRPGGDEVRLLAEYRGEAVGRGIEYPDGPESARLPAELIAERGEEARARRPKAGGAPPARGPRVLDGQFRALALDLAEEPLPLLLGLFPLVDIAGDDEPPRWGARLGRNGHDADGVPAQRAVGRAADAVLGFERLVDAGDPWRRFCAG